MLYIDFNNFELNSRYEIKDEDGVVRYWSQSDFAYKQRVHIYDENDNEIGYVQYKILSIQDGVEYYSKDDIKLDLSNYVIDNKDNGDYDIRNNGMVVCSVRGGQIDIIDNNNECLLLVYGLAK